MDFVRGIFGIVFLLLVLWFFSKNRSSISLRLVFSGILLQLVFAVLLLKVPIVKDLVQGISQGVVQLTEFSYLGSTFVFGKLASEASTFGTVVAFRVLPSILFFSALSALLYHWGILQRSIRFSLDNEKKHEDFWSRMPSHVSKCFCRSNRSSTSCSTLS